MNSGQWLVVVLITACIITLIGLGIRASSSSLQIDSSNILPTLFIIGGIVLLQAWLVLVFVIDLYMQQRKLRLELEENQKQVHSDIMKKYTEQL
tara:strand:- start:1011 stop:1292 length:282 start_codon:yes stop_codon:yes gene_type:complete